MISGQIVLKILFKDLKTMLIILSIMVWDNKKKRQLIDRIEQIFETDAEYRQLLKVIQEYDIKFTENKNGCFIDLSRVDNTRALNQLQKVVKLCEEGKKYLEESTKAYNEAVKNH